VHKRVAEFTAGRLCARRAMAELGIHDFALVSAPNRRPVWPSGLVGSITHTKGFCAAVVAPQSRFLGLGIDTENAGRVTPELWERICVEAERAWIGTLPPQRQAAAAALVFACKEAVYKCQSPLTDEWLDFEDLRVEPEDLLQVQAVDGVGAVQILPTRDLAMAQRVTPPLAARFRFHGDYVSVGVALEAPSPAPTQ
jgi:4'-phosphopantetheinyl transferase EntD